MNDTYQPMELLSSACFLGFHRTCPSHSKHSPIPDSDKEVACQSEAVASTSVAHAIPGGSPGRHNNEGVQEKSPTCSLFLSQVNDKKGTESQTRTMKEIRRTSGSLQGRDEGDGGGGGGGGGGDACGQKPFVCRSS
ncbi:hypothetical protein BHE74_00011325 [Ensete ventricosum]|nr:hypothetical protein GW17_00034420 [Ensete ventricosum]RWW80328.1 hypothetical protein BHE74_00011325 [Ensete ventricosum]RZS03612.1 hypothetical protein BHM03_00033799 [Ensete ventricosum]